MPFPRLFPRERPSASALIALFGGALLGLLGALPITERGPSPIPLLAWAAISAPALGAWAGAAGARAWPFALLAPGAWMIGIALAALDSETILPTPLWAGAALAGLYLGGFGLGAALRPRRFAAPLAALALATLAAALPLKLGLAGQPLGRLDARLGAWLLDASPVTLVVESAGCDWMRHRAVYHPAGTDWFSDRRAPYSGPLAGCLAFVVGWSAAWIGLRIAARAGRPECGTQPWPCASTSARSPST